MRRNTPTTLTIFVCGRMHSATVQVLLLGITSLLRAPVLPHTFLVYRSMLV
jgi:hypothetical protein